MSDDRLRPIEIRPEASDLPGGSRPPGWLIKIAVGAGLGLLAVTLRTVGDDTTPPAAAPGTTTSAAQAGLGRVTSTTTASTTIKVTTTTTSITLAPLSLSEMVPGLDAPIQIIAQGLEPAPTVALRWSPDQPSPFRPDRSGNLSGRASYDISGGEVMWLTWQGRETVWLGVPPLASPLFIDTSGGMWHPTDPYRLAFIGRSLPSREARLYTLNVSPPTSDNISDDLVDLGPVPEGAYLMAWGAWGFALDIPAPDALRTWEVEDPADPSLRIEQGLTITVVVSPDGAPVRSIPGRVLAGSSEGHLVIRATPEAYAAAVAAGNEPVALGFAGEVIPSSRGADLTPIVVVGPDLRPTGVSLPPTPDDGTTHHLFSPDSRFVMAVEWLQGGSYSVTTVPLEPEGTPSVTSIDGVLWYVGPTADGRYLVAQDRIGNDLVFHDWGTGTSHRVPFTEGQVVALHTVAQGR